jgi:hypothetical protein
MLPNILQLTVGSRDFSQAFFCHRYKQSNSQNDDFDHFERKKQLPFFKFSQLVSHSIIFFSF